MSLLAASILTCIMGLHAEPVRSLPWCTANGSESDSGPETADSWPDPPAEPDLPAETIARVRSVANQLLGLGVASCPFQTWDDLPSHLTFDEVAICRDDGITDGFFTSAFVPHENPPRQFYLRAIGGPSGQSCVAGPFSFKKPVFLGGEDAGTTVTVERRATVSVLLVGTVPDALWEVDSAGLPQPDFGKPYVWNCAENPDDPLFEIFSFTWGNVASEAPGEHVFAPRFMYKQKDATLKSFTITLLVR